MVDNNQQPFGWTQQPFWGSSQFFDPNAIPNAQQNPVAGWENNFFDPSATKPVEQDTNAVGNTATDFILPPSFWPEQKNETTSQTLDISHEELFNDAWIPKAKEEEKFDINLNLDNQEVKKEENVEKIEEVEDVKIEEEKSESIFKNEEDINLEEEKDQTVEKEENVKNVEEDKKEEESVEMPDLSRLENVENVNVEEEKVPVVVPIQPVVDENVVETSDLSWMKWMDLSRLENEEEDDFDDEDDEDEEEIKSDLVLKFEELKDKVYDVYDADDSLPFDDKIQVLWADNEKIYVLYIMSVKDEENESVIITKEETNQDTEKKQTNNLEFTFDKTSNSLKVKVDDFLLYDEHKELLEKPNKKSQVMEKLNKFIFLLSEHVKSLEKDKEKRKELEVLFRNF